MTDIYSLQLFGEAAELPEEPPETRQEDSDSVPAPRDTGNEEAHMKVLYPGFDLERELQDPLFARLTALGGVSLEDAYCAVHHRALQAAAVEEAVRKVSLALQTGGRRPVEAGGAGAAPSVTAFDYRRATPAQRTELKKAIARAAARGEKLYPR